jgi:hypothetical protein
MIPLAQSLPQAAKSNRCAFCATSGVALEEEVLERERRPIVVAVCSDALSCYRRVRAQHGPTSPGGSSAVAA